MLAYLLYALAGWLGGRLPRRFALLITVGVSLVFRITHPGTVRIVRRNLQGIERALGRPFDPLSVQAVMDHFARSVYEFISLPNRSAAEIIERFRIVRGQEYFEAARTSGTGIIIVSAHLAGWELGGAWLAHRFGPFHTVALDHPSRRVTEYFTRRRRARGIEVHALGSSLRSLISALRNGETVVLLADRDFGTSGVQRQFFGGKTNFPTGYLHLASTTGAQLMPIFARRVGSLTEIRVEEPFAIAKGEEDSALDRMVALLEHHIAAAPEQWARFTPLWDDTEDE